MTAVSFTGKCPRERFPAVLRALYSVLLPDDARTMETMPDVAFVPEWAEGAVTNGGDEGININSESPPIVTRISTNNLGWLLGFKTEQFATQLNFGLGHAQVFVLLRDEYLAVYITYADAEAHAVEQGRVAEAVSPLLSEVRVA